MSVRTKISYYGTHPKSRVSHTRIGVGRRTEDSPTGGHETVPVYLIYDAKYRGEVSQKAALVGP
jgi:hypothetical protein